MGDDPDDDAASEARLDIVRWCLALAVSFKIHLRVNAEGYFHGWITRT